MTDFIYNDTYQGPRWRYGFINRPPGFGTMPDEGQIMQSWDKSSDPLERWRHGTVDYTRKLSRDEIYSYELVPVCYVDSDGVEHGHACRCWECRRWFLSLDACGHIQDIEFTEQGNEIDVYRPVCRWCGVPAGSWENFIPADQEALQP